ncbi:lipase 1-like [Nylanderia fulva]|uniref:lipase 1-like n=1 Tax=Nylanderia fulva TaxID=613905 RepID=UPI0010FB3A36|nr:lipase 1-like [Nylanderia fulva]
MMMNTLFNGEFLQRSWTKLFRDFCTRNFFMQEFCVNLMFMSFGYDSEQFNYTLIPLITNHDPAGSSAKTFLHYVQAIQSGKFREYDYGSEKNLLMYNSVEAPDYDLTKITVPIALFYGKNDFLCDLADVKRLYNLLPNVMDLYEIPLLNFNHVDFIWAKDAPKLVYERVFTIIKGKNPNNVTSIENNK